MENDNIPDAAFRFLSEYVTIGQKRYRTHVRAILQSWREKKFRLYDDIFYDFKYHVWAMQEVLENSGSLAQEQRDTLSRAGIDLADAWEMLDIIAEEIVEEGLTLGDVRMLIGYKNSYIEQNVERLQSERENSISQGVVK